LFELAGANAGVLGIKKCQNIAGANARVSVKSEMRDKHLGTITKTRPLLHKKRKEDRIVDNEGFAP